MYFLRSFKMTVFLIFLLGAYHKLKFSYLFVYLLYLFLEHKRLSVYGWSFCSADSLEHDGYSITVLLDELSLAD